ncbi:hypothetical protein IKQ26_05755 [bacterium]|nr:hypothetical protein [bacterium]
MANYLEQLFPSVYSHYLTPEVKPQSAPAASEQPKLYNNASSLLIDFLNQNGIVNAAVQVKTPEIASAPIDYHNNLKTMFKNNEANILGVIIRTFNAKDRVGNQLIRKGDEVGTFNNAVERLDEVKGLGINTLHVLPINPPGKKNALGTAGSLYSPADFLKIDPNIIDKNDSRTDKEQVQNFNAECHKRGIKTMLDMPSCGSFDMFEKHPEWMAIDENGYAKTPGGWNDIKMLNPWKDESKRELNPDLVKLHKDFVDWAMELGFDGLRIDVSRTKPPEFWQEIIDYSHTKDPEFAWLAETYTYEDASPQINMNYDRPKDALKAGFDSYYGQYHIYHEWENAKEFHDYIIDNLKMSYEFDKGKSVIGSFGTHDDNSLMEHGGPDFLKQVAAVEATIPMLNTYFFDGFQSGDDYRYDFDKQQDEYTETDSHDCFVHTGRPDIFNLSRPLIGKHHDIGQFMRSALKVKENYKDLITKGSYIPLAVDKNPEDKLIAFARHYKGKTIVVIINKDVNKAQHGSVMIPGLSEKQTLKNLFQPYGDQSVVQAQDGKINVEMGKSRVVAFEINTPDIENSGLPVYKQNL